MRETGVGGMTNHVMDLKSLKNYATRLTTVVNELQVLEDGKDADYSEIVTDVGYCTVLLEQRRERLQRRGRCL